MVFLRQRGGDDTDAGPGVAAMQYQQFDGNTEDVWTDDGTDDLGYQGLVSDLKYSRRGTATNLAGDDGGRR